jgi:UDPglucose 6-dehydrogenase
MKITIVGSGYVGLVTGTCFAEVGIEVSCVDVDKKKIESLNKGVVPIYEPGLAEMIERNLQKGRLHFTTDLVSTLHDCEVVFIAVGTPPDEDGSADLKYVLEVAREVGKNIEEYILVVTKSTVPVGTSNKVSAAIQEELDKRKSGVEFDVASNPEFLKEGAAINDFLKPDRIVVGTGSPRAEALQAIYPQRTSNHIHGYRIGRNDKICGKCNAGNKN